jgi:hypothetical protein
MIFTKRFFLIIILIFTFSCQNTKNKTETLGDSKDFSDVGIQEIGKLYYPEKIDARPVKVLPDNVKKDYIIEITNSDLLEQDSINLKRYSKNIACLYKEDLIKNRSNFENIIVKINNRNGKNQNFEFTHDELIKTIKIKTKN